jgi:DNA-binding LytR/AlgR family response regulator
MKLRVLIADDEELARLRLRDLLREIPDVEVCGEAENGRQAVSLVKKLKPDLLLLDIQMPGMDGFAVLRDVENPPLVVFETAHDEHALKAFEAGSLDYLLKPFGKDRLRKAVERARARLGEGGTRPAPDIRNLLEKLGQARGSYRTRFTSLKRGRVTMLDAGDITHFRLEDTILFAHTAADRYPLKGTLEVLEADLDPERFFRCHRNVIVNLDHIREIKPLFKDSHLIILNDSRSTPLPLSRRQARLLRERFPW